MKSDGPIILAALLLAAGLTLIFSYGVGTAGMNAAYPVSAASLNLSISTAGPAAMGGIALLAVGLLVLVWALLCAFIGLFRRDGFSSDREERRIERLERKRLAREEKLERAELKRQERFGLGLNREERLRQAYPKE
jgi:hypothetical protein